MIVIIGDLFLYWLRINLSWCFLCIGEAVLYHYSESDEFHFREFHINSEAINQKIQIPHVILLSWTLVFNLHSNMKRLKQKLLNTASSLVLVLNL